MDKIKRNIEIYGLKSDKDFNVKDEVLFQLLDSGSDVEFEDLVNEITYKVSDTVSEYNKIKEEDTEYDAYMEYLNDTDILSQYIEVDDTLNLSENDEIYHDNGDLDYDTNCYRVNYTFDIDKFLQDFYKKELQQDIDKNAQYIEVELGDKRDPKVEMGEFDGKVVAIRVKDDDELSGADIEAYCQAYYKDVMRESGYYDVISITPLTEEEVKDNYDYYKISEVNNMPLLTNELAQKLIQDKNNDEVER